MTKEQRAEIFQFLYELHQKFWGEFIEAVEWGVYTDIIVIKNEIIQNKYGLSLTADCLGCELNAGGVRRCNCFLNLDCNVYCSPWRLLMTVRNSIMSLDIPTMREIQNCGWKDNGMPDEDLIGILIKLM